MALVLGVSVDKDNEIFLDDLRVTIDQIVSPTQVKITIHGEFVEEKKVINDKTYTEVTNKVQMMLGLSGNQQGFCRVMVEAPKNIKILRGKLKAES